MIKDQKRFMANQRTAFIQSQREINRSTRPAAFSQTKVIREAPPVAKKCGGGQPMFKRPRLEAIENRIHFENV